MRDVLTVRNPAGKHANMAGLSEQGFDDLVSMCSRYERTGRFLVIKRFALYSPVSIRG